MPCVSRWFIPEVILVCEFYGDVTLPELVHFQASTPLPKTQQNPLYILSDVKRLSSYPTDFDALTKIARAQHLPAATLMMSGMNEALKSHKATFERIVSMPILEFDHLADAIQFIWMRETGLHRNIYLKKSI